MPRAAIPSFLHACFVLAACTTPPIATAGGFGPTVPHALESAARAPEVRKIGPSVEFYDEHILFLSRDGKLNAWQAADLSPDRELARALAGRRLALLAAGHGQLWGTDLLRLYRWLPETRTWQPGPGLPHLGEPFLDLVVVRDGPAVVYASHIFDASTGKVHPVPGGELRALAVLASGTRIWVGTGHGEWGGSLEVLDLVTGRWARYADSLQYATGLADAGAGNVWVSWSMSHFFANTLVRLHRPDATPERSYPSLKNKYLQALAWDGMNQVLYGVEQNDLVRLEDGRPVKLLSLGELHYGGEPAAVGVSPGVTAMRILGPGRLLVVHQSAPLRVYSDGKLVVLEPD